MKEFFKKLWNRLNRRKVKLRTLTPRQTRQLDRAVAHRPTVEEYFRE